MRTIVSLALVAACIATAALADDPVPRAAANGEITPDWSRRPEARDFARNYPEAALESGISGIVILCCTPREDRTIDCASALDWPRGHGFAEAAETISERFRISEETATLYRETPNAWMQVEIRMNVMGRQRQFEPHFQTIRDATQTLCMPAANSSEVS